MSTRGSNNNIGKAARPESAAETQARLKSAGQPIYELVDEKHESIASRLVRVLRPDPANAPPLELPITESAAEQGIKAKGRATEAGVRQDVETSRVELLTQRAEALGRLVAARFRRSQAEVLVAEAERERDAFMERVPGWRRFRLGRVAGRLMKVAPWLLVVADTTIMARPWGVFGSVPLPFVHSADANKAGQLVRAGAVSFALVFGMRLAGAKLRDLADRERLLNERVGNLVDLLVLVVAIGSAVMLAQATAKMQAATVDVLTGGTGVSVPLSSLTSVVLFMMAMSFVFGYFLNEAEIEQAAINETRVTEARAWLAEAVAAESVVRAEVRSLREQLKSLDRRERHEVDEQKAHTDVEVAVHKDGNKHLYGIDVAAKTTTADASPIGTTDATTTPTTSVATTNGSRNGRSKVKGRG